MKTRHHRVTKCYRYFQAMKFLGWNPFRIEKTFATEFMTTLPYNIYDITV